MVRALTRSHVLILPLIILVVVLLEGIAEYQARRLIDDIYVRTSVIMALYAVGFTVAFELISPRLKSLLVSVRKSSRKRGGKIGVWIFFLVAYAIAYYAYLQVEIHGAAAIQPKAWQ